MERLEFIEKIFTLYRVNPENNRDLALIYDDAFSTRKPVDWDKLYRMVIASAEGGGLPKPGYFTSRFELCLKAGETTTPDGLKVKLTLNDGYSYEFETYHLSYTLEEIKQKFMKKYRDKFKSLSLFDEEQLEWVIF